MSTNRFVKFWLILIFVISVYVVYINVCNKVQTIPSDNFNPTVQLSKDTLFSLVLDTKLLKYKTKNLVIFSFGNVVLTRSISKELSKTYLHNTVNFTILHLMYVILSDYIVLSKQMSDNFTNINREITVLYTGHTSLLSLNVILHLVTQINLMRCKRN